MFLQEYEMTINSYSIGYIFAILLVLKAGVSGTLVKKKKKIYIYIYIYIYTPLLGTKNYSKARTSIYA